MKKYDYVQLKELCDSPFLFIGDKGRIVSDVLDDDSVAVAFDEPFEDSHDCDGLAENGNGWYVQVSALKLVTKNIMNPVISNPILLEALEKEFEFNVTPKGIVFDGFYKSGTVTLVPQENGTFIAHSRYDQKDTIESFEDLVHLNYEWWQKSKNRSDFWENPIEKWGAEMIRLGLVKKQVEQVVKYI